MPVAHRRRRSGGRRDHTGRSDPLEAAAEAGRAPGAIHGTSVRMPLTLNIPAGIPLEPGIYEWRVEVEGYERATAVEAFIVAGGGHPPASCG